MPTAKATISEVVSEAYSDYVKANIGSQVTVNDCVKQGWSEPHVAAIGTAVVIFDGVRGEDLIQAYRDTPRRSQKYLGGKLTIVHWTDEDVTVQFVERGRERRWLKAGLNGDWVWGSGDITPVELAIIVRIAQEQQQPLLVKEWCQDSIEKDRYKGSPARQKRRAGVIEPLVIGLLSESVGMPFFSAACQSGPGYKLDLSL